MQTDDILALLEREAQLAEQENKRASAVVVRLAQQELRRLRDKAGEGTLRQAVEQAYSID